MQILTKFYHNKHLTRYGWRHITINTTAAYRQLHKHVIIQHSTVLFFIKTTV